MKAVKLFGLSLSLLLQLMSQTLLAQCKYFINKVDFSPLNEYAYCSEVKSAHMYRSDSAEVIMKLNSRTKYRILIEAQKYLGEIDLEVKDQSNEFISIPIQEEEKRFWEIFSEEKGKVNLKIKFKNSYSYNRSNQEIDAAGCVVLAVGKISLEELVDNSAKTSDL